MNLHHAHIAEEIDRVLGAAIRGAVWAPSVHNTQPWSFAVSGDEISLRADVERGLRVEDPAGRELLISCGAALFNVRITLRALGYEPVTWVLPDPDRRALLATVRLGDEVEPDEHTRLLYGEIERRRTHRAGFTALPLSGQLIDALVTQAGAEGARLAPVREEAAVRVFAALTNAAQDAQSLDRMAALETRRWARPPGSSRPDGVPANAYPQAALRTDPHFAQRDYAGGHPWGGEEDQRVSGHTGLVAVLTTMGDAREDWMRAGQALQRALLHASAYGVSAAFHTQALEMYHLREFLREEMCSGAYPQMIMRMGFTVDEAETRRRSASDVVDEV